MIGLDFFDASINRVAAWVIGTRNMQKALLFALLQPNERLKKLQDNGEFTELFMLQEECKTLPFGEVWEEYCRRENVPATAGWFDEIRRYEDEVQRKRESQ
jgi:L-rhamnose isomerase